VSFANNQTGDHSPAHESTLAWCWWRTCVVPTASRSADYDACCRQSGPKHDPGELFPLDAFLARVGAIWQTVSTFACTIRLQRGGGVVGVLNRLVTRSRFRRAHRVR
jgi:hypothetical protein